MTYEQILTIADFLSIAKIAIKQAKRESLSVNDFKFYEELLFKSDQLDSIIDDVSNILDYLEGNLNDL